MGSESGGGDLKCVTRFPVAAAAAAATAATGQRDGDVDGQRADGPFIEGGADDGRGNGGRARKRVLKREIKGISLARKKRKVTSCSVTKLGEHRW